MRSTKILATLGPSSSSKAIIEKLLAEGADAFRLNLAHGTAEEHEKIVKILRRLEKDVAVIADIRGSKIRVGKMPPEGVLLLKGSRIIVDTTRS